MSTDTTQQNDPIAEALGIEFSLSAEGFPVARTRELVLAMITTPAGSFLASAWRPMGPLSALKQQDFYRHDGHLADEGPSSRASSKLPSISATCMISAASRPAFPAARLGACHSLRRCMDRESCVTPLPAMAASIFLPTETFACPPPSETTAAGTKKISNGRWLPTPFRTCSRDMSDGRRTKPSGTTGRSFGRMCMVSCWSQESLVPRIAKHSTGSMRPTGSCRLLFYLTTMLE